jgi:DNA-binding transcriptional MocR family regulator
MGVALAYARTAYGDPAGVVPLRVAIAEHLRAARGVRCEAEQVLRVSVYNADAGLHVAVLLPAGLDDRDVVRRMTRRGLTATALSTCYAGTARRSGLLLGFGGSTARRLVEATRVLGEILRDSGESHA